MPETIKINSSICRAIRKIIDAALEYEKLTRRRAGITGEVGEFLVCKKLNLSLVVNQINAGYDALDKEEKRYQIKTRRITNNHIAGRIGSFSKHKFDYAVLAILDKGYELKKIYKMSYKKLVSISGRHRRRNPPVREFIRNSK